MSVLSAPHFHNEKAAYAYVEARLWPNGPVCPRCKGTDRIGKMGGESTRIGTYKCYACRKPFTVKVGTIFEASHVPMRHWLQVMYFMASSKKGISTNQIQRTLGCHMKTAWFVGHRVREAMTDGSFAPFGGGGGDVEADETFIGQAPDAVRKSGPRGHRHMNTVFTIVDRQTGRAHSQVMPTPTSKNINDALVENVARDTRLLTDSAPYYLRSTWTFQDHRRVNHSIGEYVNADDATIHTNTVEGVFSIFKRGMKGIYQHCAAKHLHRYAAEFDFRYSNRKALGIDDVARADKVLAGVVGKRLMYPGLSARRPGAEARVVW